MGATKERENRLQDAKLVIREHLDYNRELVTFKQVDIESGGGPTLCLAIIVVQSCEAVGVNDGAERFTYPVRLETGKERGSRPDIASQKRFLKNDNLDFLNELLQFVRDH